MAGEAKEKCAVVGAVSSNPEIDTSLAAYWGLEAMQHRGDDASGIASVNNEGEFNVRRQLGMVKDVFKDGDALAEFAGPIAVGHNKYTTSGTTKNHLQPYAEKPIAFGFGHNGTLPETSELETFLEKRNVQLDAINDSEMAGFAIAQHIRSGKELPDAVEETYPMLVGAFSCVAMSQDTLVAFRDECGIRPLALGAIQDGYMVASETCALDTVGAEYIREVQPGEMVILTKGGLESRQLAEPNPKLDIFEDVYFSSPASVLHDQHVGYTRFRLGEQLALEHPLTADDLRGDTVVVGAPESAIPIAAGYAQALGLPHVPALIKNRYQSKRSFMQDSDSARQGVIKKKMTIVPEFVKDKNVVMVDDSIVRGNTIPRLKKLIMGAGAKSLSVVVGSPPLQFPDFYGIDTPNQDELIAANLSVEKIRETFGLRYLGYLSLKGMVKATGQPEHVFNLSSFTGEYPIDIGEENWSKIKPPLSLEYLEE